MDKVNKILFYTIRFSFKLEFFEPGDIIIDGGNSEYRDTQVSTKENLI